MGPKTNDKSPYKKRKHREKARSMRRRPCGKSRDGSGVATSQGTPRLSGSLWKLGEGPWDRVTLRNSQGNYPYQHLDFRLPASRAARERISAVVSHPVTVTGTAPLGGGYGRGEGGPPGREKA